MSDIKNMQDVNSVWMIEEAYLSVSCRHLVLGGNTRDTCGKTGHICGKDICPLKVGRK